MGALIVVWLALCVVVGFYAEGKGRSGVGIFFLSLFLSPLVGLIAAVAMRPDEKNVASAQGKKKCPECAEFVQPDAKVCRFCRHNFTEEEEATGASRIEAEQLSTAGIRVGPPCPTCSSIYTYHTLGVKKAAHWWKQLNIRLLHCHKCGEEWSDGSVPREAIKRWVLAIVFVTAFAFYVLLYRLFNP